MPFDPKDIPELTGKVIFITGGTTGIGKSTLLELARHGAAHIYFTGRNATAGAAVLAEAQKLAPSTRFTFIKSDLAASREQIKNEIASNFTSDRLDMLIANAGIMATPAGLTAEGFETQFGTNYFGHAILLRLLLPKMLRTAELPGRDVRLIVLSSFGHTMAPEQGIDFDNLRVPEAGTTWTRYGQSKLADILLAKAMSKRYPQVTSLSVHPGLVKTELSGRSEPSMMVRFFNLLTYTPFMKSAETGAYNTLWAATTDKGDLVNGGYYAPVGKVPGKVSSFNESGMSDICNDEALADRLWEWTERELGEQQL